MSGYDGNYGIDRYVSADAIVDALGEVHVLLDDGLWEQGILGGETEKTIRRALKGWAEQRERPGCWPWTHRAFHDFPWGVK